MKKTTFYPSIWQTVPYTFEVMDQLDAEGKRTKDLVLTSVQSIKMGISEMNLTITGISAIDSNGVEHSIENFPKLSGLNIKGLHTGHFLRSKTMLQLEAGKYSSFRFYLEQNGNSFVLTDKSEIPTNRFEYLDFEIEGGLEIYGDEVPEVILRFDFQPYDFPVFFKKTGQFFSSVGSYFSQLVQSMEHERLKV